MKREYPQRFQISKSISREMERGSVGLLQTTIILVLLSSVFLSIGKPQISQLMLEQQAVEEAFALEMGGLYTGLTRVNSGGNVEWTADVHEMAADLARRIGDNSGLEACTGLIKFDETCTRIEEQFCWAHPETGDFVSCQIDEGCQQGIAKLENKVMPQSCHSTDRYVLLLETFSKLSDKAYIQVLPSKIVSISDISVNDLRLNPESPGTGGRASGTGGQTNGGAGQQGGSGSSGGEGEVGNGEGY